MLVTWRVSCQKQGYGSSICVDGLCTMSYDAMRLPSSHNYSIPNAVDCLIAMYLRCSVIQFKQPLPLHLLTLILLAFPNVP